MTTEIVDNTKQLILNNTQIEEKIHTIIAVI